jgi:hypothetical protein
MLDSVEKTTQFAKANERLIAARIPDAVDGIRMSLGLAQIYTILGEGGMAIELLSIAWRRLPGLLAIQSNSIPRGIHCVTIRASKK